MLSKIRVWDPGSVIRDPRYGIRKKTYYGSRIPGSGSATLVLTCLFESKFIMIWIQYRLNRQKIRTLVVSYGSG
jgi:hypothetical protein